MVYRALGAEPKCGKCVPFVRQALRQAAESAISAKAAGAD
jgi:bacterioferritin-associated ferredoxin